MVPNSTLGLEGKELDFSRRLGAAWVAATAAVVFVEEGRGSKGCCPSPSSRILFVLLLLLLLLMLVSGFNVGAASATLVVVTLFAASSPEPLLLPRLGLLLLV